MTVWHKMIPSRRRRSDRLRACPTKPLGTCVLAIETSYCLLTVGANVAARKSPVLIRNPLATRRPLGRPLPQRPAFPHPPNLNFRHRRLLFSGFHRGRRGPTGGRVPTGGGVESITYRCSPPRVGPWGHVGTAKKHANNIFYFPCTLLPPLPPTL